MSRGSSRTPKRDERFFQQLSVDPNVSLAAKMAGYSRSRVYEYRANDETFAARWDEAVETATDELESEARRRALKGVEEPVFHAGEIVGHRKRYSDTLLIFTLKGLRPEKWRERHEITGAGGKPLFGDYERMDESEITERVVERYAAIFERAKRLSADTEPDGTD